MLTNIIGAPRLCVWRTRGALRIRCFLRLHSPRTVCQCGCEKRVELLRESAVDRYEVENREREIREGRTTQNGV